MPRLFIALPVPEEIADELTTLQSGVPDARWVPRGESSRHAVLRGRGAGRHHEGPRGGAVRHRRAALSVALAGVEQFWSGKQPRALVAPVERSERLDWLQQKVSTVVRNCGIEIDRRKFRPHVTLARFASGAETGHHIAQFMASHDLPGRAVDRRPFRALFEPARQRWLGLHGRGGVSADVLAVSEGRTLTPFGMTTLVGLAQRAAPKSLCSRTE